MNGAMTKLPFGIGDWVKNRRANNAMYGAAIQAIQERQGKEAMRQALVENGRQVLSGSETKAGLDAEKAVGTLVFLTIMSFIIYAAALILGIIGIITSSGASKEAKAAGEPKTIATIGLILSIVGTVFGGIGFLFCSTCLACTTCASCKLVQAAKAM